MADDLVYIHLGMDSWHIFENFLEFLFTQHRVKVPHIPVFSAVSDSII